MARRSFTWNSDTVIKAVERFRLETGEWPTSHNFMSTDYLPDPDTIRRLFGGLPVFRKKFGFDVEDYTKGKVRSDLNKELNDRAKLHEDQIHKILEEHFGEICVHKEREFSYRSRVDFQVYHANGIFGVDTFYPKNRYALMNIFNIKFVKYKKFLLGPMYLVCMNNELNQTILDNYLEKRRNDNENNIKLVSEESFTREISKYSRKTEL